MIREPTVLRAIAAAGSVTKLSLLCGISPQSIYYWRKIPDRHVNAIARKLKIPRHELRPDLWPLKPTKGAQNAERPKAED
jgi:DNA-binding transcriptional regulator YdaS (Cro superfamily)